MRWRFGAVAWAAALAIGLGGCAGGDDTPTPSAGEVGDCYGNSSTKAVDCAGPHVAETVFVRREAPPQSPKALFPCREAQARYLGQDFNTRLDVQLWIASDLSWYRCDVFVRNSTQGGNGYQSVTGSLKDVLEKGVSVDLQSCLSEPYDPAGDQVYIPCAEPHVAQELIVAPAIGTVDEPFPDDVADRAARACNATAAASDLIGPDTRVEAYYPKTADAWASGERTADCWIIATSGVLPPVTRTQ